MFASKDVFLTPPSAGGYTIARSVRFRQSASAYFNKTYASSGNTQKWTWSGWVKLGDIISQTTGFNLLSCGNSTSNYDRIEFYANQLQYQLVKGGGGIISADVGSMLMRDPSAWYHIVVAIDTTQATLANRAIIYVNGIKRSTVNYATQNSTTLINSNSYASYIGKQAYTTEYYDGYMTEVNFIDGQQLTPSSFGSTNSITGVWQPAKYTGTYGTNGFYLNFSDNSSNTATTIGKDYSGNGNNWTPNNISVTAGATYDSMTDVPTLTSATAANYAVFNPLAKGANVTISDGNLKYSTSSVSGTNGIVSMLITSGMKSYFEFTVGSVSLYRNISIGGMAYTGDSGSISGGTGGTGTFATWTTSDVIAFACDFTAGTVACYKNNALQTTVTGVTNTSDWQITAAQSTNTTGEYYANFGQQGFKYTPPTGFVALNTYNLPASTITNGAAYMNTLLYTGDGNTTKSITGLSFAPDFVWHKTRSNADDHRLVDIVRGGGTDLSSSILYSNLTNAQDNSSGYITQTSSGFNLGVAATPLNMSGRTYVAWNWKANGAGVSNTNGSITSTVSVGATQGFSVVTYTGNGTNGATVGHGLGVIPSLIIEKGRTSTYNWSVQGCGKLWTPATSTLFLNTTGALNAGGAIAAPTSSVFTPSAVAYANESGVTNVAYVFSAVAGYSAFGSYTGNGSSDGPFVYTNFKPRFVIIKNSTTAGTDWDMYDSSRSTYNQANAVLRADTSGAELSILPVDFLSNGFKIRDTGTDINTSSATMIYMAFAENPFRNALAR